MRFRLLIYVSTAAAAVLLLGQYLLYAHPDENTCPHNQEELNAFVLACRASTDCENPAITCNGEFSIELTEFITDGDLITYTYEICKLKPTGKGTPALSHWVLGVDLACLSDGNTLSDILVGYSVNGEAAVPCDDPMTEEGDEIFLATHAEVCTLD